MTVMVRVDGEAAEHSISFCGSCDYRVDSTPDVPLTVRDMYRLASQHIQATDPGHAVLVIGPDGDRHWTVHRSRVRKIDQPGGPS